MEIPYKNNLTMEKLEKYSLDAIRETLESCATIRVAIIYDKLVDIMLMSRFMLDSGICKKPQFEIEYSNGSRLQFLSSSKEEDLCGLRFHQIFISGEVSEKTLRMVRPLVTFTSRERGPIFKTGVFRLWEEARFTRSLAESVMKEISNARSISSLRYALSKGVAAIDNEYAN